MVSGTLKGHVIRDIPTLIHNPIPPIPRVCSRTLIGPNRSLARAKCSYECEAPQDWYIVNPDVLTLPAWGMDRHDCQQGPFCDPPFMIETSWNRCVLLHHDT